MTRTWREPPGEWIEDRSDPDPDTGMRFWQAVVIGLLVVTPFWITLAWVFFA